jgi:uncharacterized membrane protein
MTRWLALSIALTVLAVAGTLFVCANADQLLPAKVPTHWNIKGVADAWTTREDAWKYLLIMPGVMVLMLGLTLALPWLSPKKFDVDRFAPTYHYIMFLVQFLFGYLTLVIIAASMDRGYDIGRMFAEGFFIFWALLGNVMGKVRRNFYVGVKTPWTLASETVWNQTHRLAGYLMVATGILGFVLVVSVPGTLILIVSFALMMIAALYPVMYSLLLYKRLERQGLLPEARDNAAEPVAERR